MDFDHLPSLRQVIENAGLFAKKSLGQNFILDSQVTDKIARLAGITPESTVLEIGPGPGGLTRSLLKENPLKVIAIEKDHRCLQALEPLRQAAQGRLEIIEADALKLSLKSISDRPVIIVANLPYNIATRLLLNWCQEKAHIIKMVLMFQKEVADRLVAIPRSSAYGSLSVWIQWQLEVRQRLTLAPQVFFPAPKVFSTVVDFSPRPQPLYQANPQALETLLATSFQQRRKMLRRSLKDLPDFSPTWFETTGISPEARPEELTIQDFCTLSQHLKGTETPV